MPSIKMPEEASHCPLCKAGEHNLFDQQVYMNRTVSYQRCLNCGLVYQSPRMTEEELDHFYAGEYRQLYQGDEGPSRKDLLVQAGRAETLLRFVKDRIPATRRHLDIGASAGTLLACFARYYRTTSIGIEPGAAYRAYAQAQGLTVYPSQEALEDAGEAPFDLISLLHVLEHLPDPVGYLAGLRQGLFTPSGWLLLEVPNLYSHTSFEVAHPVAFSPHTLQQTLRRAGFETIYLLKHGQPRSVVLPLYLTVLARPIADPPSEGVFHVQRERAVTFKRRAGMFRRRLLERAFPDLAWLQTP